MDELAGKASQLNHIPGLDNMDRHMIHPVFLQLQVHQRHSQLGSVDMGGNLLQDIGRTADMILMPVGKQISADMVLFAQQIGHIRNHQINPEHVLLREHAPAIHNDHIVLIFENGHVFADFIHAAQRDDSQFSHFFFFRRGHWNPPFFSLKHISSKG